MKLVGFFDLLGTSEKVKSDRFSDTDILEFVNAIGVAAEFTPNVRFAVFSDSLILTADPSEIQSLLRAINFMYANWFSELVYVRGGISCGDIQWVNDSSCDNSFRQLVNLTYSRIYGKGLVMAYQLEQQSGPGAICFLTQQAAAMFREKESASVLDGRVPMLCWATEEQAKKAEGYALSQAEGSQESFGSKHYEAARHYWTSVMAHSKFLPAEYDICC